MSAPPCVRPTAVIRLPEDLVSAGVDRGPANGTQLEFNSFLAERAPVDLSRLKRGY